MTGELIARPRARGLPSLAQLAGWLVPLLALAGMGISAYLTFVHYNGLPLVCEASGGCHTVQSSEYAKLLGVPVATLGLGLYTCIFVASLVSMRGVSSAGEVAPYLVFGMALSGVLYSSYLTWIELHRINAVCAWCVASASILAAIFVIAVGQLIMLHWEEEDAGE